MTFDRIDTELQSQINMTPLIDVMLVLLIIFIITIPIRTDSITIDNPRPNADSRAYPRQVIRLSIDFDGTMAWNGQVVNRVVLQTQAGVYAARTPQPEVHLSVDKFAKYASVAQTLADLQARGLKIIDVVNSD